MITTRQTTWGKLGQDGVQPPHPPRLLHLCLLPKRELDMKHRCHHSLCGDYTGDNKNCKDAEAKTTADCFCLVFPKLFFSAKAQFFVVSQSVFQTGCSCKYVYCKKSWAYRKQTPCGQELGRNIGTVVTGFAREIKWYIKSWSDLMDKN